MEEEERRYWKNGQLKGGTKWHCIPKKLHRSRRERREDRLAWITVPGKGKE